MESEIDNKHWNERYLDKVVPGTPCYVLEHFQTLLPKSGVALDLACGLAGNAVLLAQHGLQTYAWDYSNIVIDKVREYAQQYSLDISAECLDVSKLASNLPRFDVITVSYFLDRALIPKIISWLNSGGLVFFQTFTRLVIVGESASGPLIAGPKNPAYRLAENELLECFQGLNILVYQELGSVGTQPYSGLRNEAFVIGQKT